MNIFLLQYNKHQSSLIVFKSKLKYVDATEHPHLVSSLTITQYPKYMYFKVAIYVSSKKFRFNYV